MNTLEEGHHYSSVSKIITAHEAGANSRFKTRP